MVRFSEKVNGLGYPPRAFLWGFYVVVLLLWEPKKGATFVLLSYSLPFKNKYHENSTYFRPLCFCSNYFVYRLLGRGCWLLCGGCIEIAHWLGAPVTGHVVEHPSHFLTLKLEI